MHATHSLPGHSSTRNPLALGIAACLLLTTPLPGLAAERLVTNCNDSGQDSLRDVIDNQAQSGDTVDLSYLICGTISLTTGAIYIEQDNLTLLGPENMDLIIEGGPEYPWPNHYGFVLRHEGNGTLQMEHLVVTSPVAQPYHSEDGACISSESNVYLKNMLVTDCIVETSSNHTQGGAIFTEGNLTLVDSVVKNSGILSHGSGDDWLRGGGVAVMGNLELHNSNIVDNSLFTESPTPTRGGGIWVAGNTSIEDSRISGNTVQSYDEVRGGGIYSGGDLSLLRSTVSGNTSHGADFAKGGGLFVHGSLTMTDSVVAANTAVTTTYENYSELYDYSGGGGIWSEGPFSIYRSTIVGNVAEQSAGLVLLDSTTGHPRIIANSTVSGNQSTTVPAGIYAVSLLTLHNSTIAFNAASEYSQQGGAGIRSLLGIEMQSTIVADNWAGQLPADVNAPVTGSNNLIHAPGGSTVPGDTYVGVPARLGELSDNGGPTPTIALLEDSIAIDHGGNPDGRSWDQRGPGYVRVNGNVADIGAFEFDPDARPDAIFANGFEP